jgi:hypothetical protein
MAIKKEQAFEDRKQAALNAAREEGIVDVVTTVRDGVSPETVELAARLMKKHGQTAYGRLEARRNAQK